MSAVRQPFSMRTFLTLQGQGQANYGSGLPIFVNQVLLEPSHAHSFGIVCGSFCTTATRVQ